MSLSGPEARSAYWPMVPPQASGSASPSPRSPVRQLKRKADLAPDHWSDDLRVFRYTAESFGAPFRAL